MKKVYIPTVDELYQMQDLSQGGAHIYKYMIAKAVEVLVMEGKLELDKKPLEIAYRYFREFPDIAYAICKMYPQNKMHCSEEVRMEIENDVVLCQNLINGISKQDDSIKQLDYILAYFENGTCVVTHNEVIKAILNKLVVGLSSYPQYRFEYKDNTLLDEIFGCDLPEWLMPIGMDEHLMVIDPAYTNRLNGQRKLPYSERVQSFKKSVNQYANRYIINQMIGAEYLGMDIISRPDEKTRKLLRCLEQHKNKYY